MKQKLISSLEKVFFTFPEEAAEVTRGSMLRNECHSFQLVVAAEPGQTFRIAIDSAIRDLISVYEIGHVPSQYPCNPENVDEDYITTAPGFFPDPMYPLEDGRFAMREGVAALWFAVQGNGACHGTYPITIGIHDSEERLLGQCCYTVRILDICLPPQKLLSTGWFHGDCLAVLHGVPVGSEEYLQILDKYLEVYGKFGHNTILTPVFTPPLDTDIGGERPTNQLVDVSVVNGDYRFGFSRLGRWIDRCRSHGIQYFEISHLFTQWGAFYAPKIMAVVDGEEKRIFGWETDALSEEYRRFLDAFLPELRRFLEKKGVYEHCLFHVSDEPHQDQVRQYRQVRQIVTAHIDEEQMMDAISDYVFYETGLIHRPVACNDQIGPFLKHQADHLWTYYCCAQGRKVANRFMAMPSYRSRILGYQLYKYRIEGFLQWGFNFWFTARSKAVVDPYQVTDAGQAFPSGDAFLVYPLNARGEVVTSLRLYVFAQALQDLRALELLESLTSRETVESMLTEVVGFDDYPRSADYILNLREQVNAMIEALI